MTEPQDPHVSDLTWDRLNAGKLAPELAERARRHAAGCARCAARREALEAEHRRFAAAPPPLDDSATPAGPGADAAPVADAATATDAAPERTWRSSRTWRYAVPLAGAAAAAAVAAIIVTRAQPAEPPPSATRTKGGFAVTAFAGRDGDAVPLGDGDPVFPGDRLQLAYSAERAGHLAVLAIDGAGRAHVYFPTTGTATWAAPAGPRVALPASTELDGVLGDERLWIVHCERRQLLASLVAALDAGGHAAAPPPGCEVQRLRFTKRAR